MIQWCPGLDTPLVAAALPTPTQDGAPGTPSSLPPLCPACLQGLWQIIPLFHRRASPIPAFRTNLQIKSVMTSLLCLELSMAPYCPSDKIKVPERRFQGSPLPMTSCGSHSRPCSFLWVPRHVAFYYFLPGVGPLHMLSRFSCVQLFATLWTVARQPPLSREILQARILEWVAMSSCRGSSRLRD